MTDVSQLTLALDSTNTAHLSELFLYFHDKFYDMILSGDFIGSYTYLFAFHAAWDSFSHLNVYAPTNWNPNRPLVSAWLEQINALQGVDYLHLNELSQRIVIALNQTFELVKSTPGLDKLRHVYDLGRLQFEYLHSIGVDYNPIGYWSKNTWSSALNHVLGPLLDVQACINNPIGTHYHDYESIRVAVDSYINSWGNMGMDQNLLERIGQPKLNISYPDTDFYSIKYPKFAR